AIARCISSGLTRPLGSSFGPGSNGWTATATGAGAGAAASGAGAGACPMRAAEEQAASAGETPKIKLHLDSRMGRPSRGLLYVASISETLSRIQPEPWRTTVAGYGGRRSFKGAIMKALFVAAAAALVMGGAAVAQQSPAHQAAEHAGQAVFVHA